MKRRAFEGSEWADHDLRWVAAYLALLFLGFAYPALLYVAAFVPVVVVVFLAVRHWRRKRRWEREGPPEFWADKIR